MLASDTTWTLAARRLGFSSALGVTVIGAAYVVTWDLFLGLSLLLMAPAFAGGKLQTVVRGAIMLSGALCAAGFLGPLLGNMRLQMLAIGGYAFGLPVACALLAVLFRRTAAS